MIASTIAFIVASALLGGFISGLAGFGTGLVALGIWLHAVPPAEDATLVIFCSVIAQGQTIPAVWHAIDFPTIWPILLAGTIGAPIGVAALAYVNPDIFRIGTGIVLVLFSGVSFLGRGRMNLQWGGRIADAAIGLGGGILGIRLGSRTYQRLSDTQFHHTVIALLAISGVILLSPLLFAN